MSSDIDLWPPKCHMFMLEFWAIIWANIWRNSLQTFVQYHVHNNRMAVPKNNNASTNHSQTLYTVDKSAGSPFYVAPSAQSALDHGGITSREETSWTGLFQWWHPRSISLSSLLKLLFLVAIKDFIYEHCITKKKGENRTLYFRSQILPE